MATDKQNPLGSELQEELGVAWIKVDCVSEDEGGTEGRLTRQVQQDDWDEREGPGSGPPTGDEREGPGSGPPTGDEREGPGSGPPTGPVAASFEEDFPPPPSNADAFWVEGSVESNCMSTDMGNTYTLGDEEWPPVVLMVGLDIKTDCGNVSLRSAEADPPTHMPQDQSPESPEDPDAPVLLGVDREEHRMDCKPTCAGVPWGGQESHSNSLSLLQRPSVFSSDSSQSTEPNPHDNICTDANTCDTHQGEPSTHSLSSDNEIQEGQQVCKSAPPLETVAGETANPEPGSPTCGSIVVKEPLIEAAGCREGERASEQTEDRRNRAVSGSGSAASGETARNTEYLGTNEEKEEVGLSFIAAQRSGSTSNMDMDHFDDSQSDSGVSADFSPNSTVEMSCGSVGRGSPEPSRAPPAETPIEREIRLALRREQSLRRSRGLDASQDKAKEFVELPLRKSVLSQDLPLKSVRGEGKDRHFAGKKMQQEIRVEAEREKVLVQLGRLPGFYDKGTVRQLREKKLLFEAFQEPKEVVAAQGRNLASRTYQEMSSTGSEAREVSGSHTEISQSLERLFQNLSPTPAARGGGFKADPSGPSLTEAVRGQVIILESSLSPATPTPGRPVGPLCGATVVDSRRPKHLPAGSGQDGRVEKRHGGGDEGSDKQPAVLKENPFFKLRSSLSQKPDVQRDIHQAREREMELRRQRTSLYGGDLENPDTPTPSDSNASPTRQPGKTPLPPASARQSHGKLDLMWPPPSQQEHKEQSEVQKSLKIRGQRSPLLEHWEAGLVNGHGVPQD